MSRTFTIGDIGDAMAPVGSPAWVKATHVETLACIHDTTVDAERLERHLETLQRDNHYQQLPDREGQPFMFWGDYCQARPPFGLGYSPAALAGVVAEGKSAQARAANTTALSPHGGVRAKGQADVISLKYGTSADYLLARLKRDHRVVFEAVERGEYPSVRAAAREVGILKPTVTVVKTPDGYATSARKHLSPQGRAALIRLLEDA